MLDQNTTEFTNILLAGGLILLFLIVLWFVFRKKESHRRVLLVGCCNGGKTVLFHLLVHGKIVQTYTSMKENIGIFTNEKRQIEIVDIPGNERIGKRLFDEYKNNIKGIIFVIDAESAQKEIRDVAESVYNVLIDPAIQSSCEEILILCNKQDLNTAKGPAVVQMLLEKELSVLRSLKNKQLDSTGQETLGKKKAPFLGSKKKDFEFAQIKPINIEFAESLLIGDQLNYDDVKHWLNKF